MRIRPFFMPILLIVGLLGTTFTAQALGIWSTSGRDAVDVTKLTPADLKGWMTLQQVIDGLPLAKEELYQVGGIPSDTPTTTALKDLEATISVTTFREKLTVYYGGGTTNTTSAVPATTPTPFATAKPTGVTGATATALAASGTTHATPTPLPTGQVLPADQIKGKNTLKEVSEQCQVSLDKLLIGLKLDPKTDPNTAIKDLISATKITDVTDVQKVVTELQKK